MYSHLLTYLPIDDLNHPGKDDLNDEKIDEVVNHVFEECSADGEGITYLDFQRIVGPTDYNTKLFLNIWISEVFTSGYILFFLIYFAYSHKPPE